MSKLDLYRNVHKEQRAALFALAADVGRADFDDEPAVTALAARLGAAIEDIRRHGEHEDRFIGPLLARRAPEIGEFLEDEHVRLEPIFGRLGKQCAGVLEVREARGEAGLALYRGICSFISVYLAHIHYEETVAMPALWAACTEEDIFGVVKAFTASRSDADALADLLHQAPALTPQERSAYVGAVISGKPQTADRILGALSGTLAAADLDRLHTDLSRVRMPA